MIKISHSFLRPFIEWAQKRMRYSPHSGRFGEAASPQKSTLARAAWGKERFSEGLQPSKPPFTLLRKVSSK